MERTRSMGYATNYSDGDVVTLLPLLHRVKTLGHRGTRRFFQTMEYLLPYSAESRSGTYMITFTICTTIYIANRTNELGRFVGTA